MLSIEFGGWRIDTLLTVGKYVGINYMLYLVPVAFDNQSVELTWCMIQDNRKESDFDWTIAIFLVDMIRIKTCHVIQITMCKWK